MSARSIPVGIPLLAALAVWGVIGLCGCHAIDYYGTSCQQPVPPAMAPPREKCLVTLPTYRIAPPDVLQVEVLKLVPLPPYRAGVYDVLEIKVTNTLLDQPIDGYFLVETEGTVTLGAAYGSVRVLGMTMEEIRQAIDGHLRKAALSNPTVSVGLARSAGTQEIAGEYLVGLDGTVNLRQYGSVHVAGRTLAEAKLAVEKHLSQYFDSPEASVSVLAYNSKVYYVITEGAGLGDTVARVPITGKETVLDAVSQVGGLSELSGKEIWVARPAPGGFGCEQIIPVDYEGIVAGASTATNYQLMPGDRVCIADNDLIAMNNVVNMVTAPLQRMAGFASLNGTTVMNMQGLGREYNQRFRR